MESELEKILEKVLKSVNEWLKFAEQKNATLIALNAGIIWGVSKLLNNIVIESTFLYWVSYGAYGFIAFSIFICILSILPILKKRWWLKKEEKSSDDNMLYFGDISKYNSGDYLKLLKKKYNIKDYEFKNSEKDYANQIVINSKIALDKYKNFTFASWLTIIGIILFLLTLSVNYFKG